MSIFKYPIEVVDEQFIEMPIMPQILCVQLQRGVPCIWAMVGYGGGTVRRRIITRGTGHDATGLTIERYIGTYQLMSGDLMSGDLVFHVFDGGDA